MWLSKLKRNTSFTYLPFIDGLRFFAIFPVVLVHIFDFYDLDLYKITETKTYHDLHVPQLIGNSESAVLLFFAISGFILAWPFARSFLNAEDKCPKLLSYYGRRLKRLEPPYLLLLTALFVLNVYVLHKFTASEVLPHYLASFFYLHNIIFEAYPTLNFVFWSLEIEVQFYLLAPLLVYVFKLPALARRFIIIVAMLGFSFLNAQYKFPFLSLLNFFQYFMAGFLALDLYLTKENTTHYFYDILSTLCFLVFWTSAITPGPALPFVLAGFIYWSSKSKTWMKVLSFQWISIIGGMCYTIYMIHHPALAFFLNRFCPNTLLFNSLHLDFLIRVVLSTLVIAVVSLFYFILVEKPFMSKNKITLKPQSRE